MDDPVEQQELKDIIASKAEGFGFQFKQQRDEQQLSVDDVARSLHLEKKIIIALEGEDYTQLPTATFVCGYIRNYSKLLNLQADPLIAYYKQETSQDDFQTKLRTTGNTKTSKKLPILAFLMPVFSLLIFVSVLLGAWQLWIIYNDSNISADNTNSIDNVSIDAPIDNNEVNDDQLSLLLPQIDNYEAETVSSGESTQIIATKEADHIDDVKVDDVNVEPTKTDISPEVISTEQINFSDEVTASIGDSGKVDEQAIALDLPAISNKVEAESKVKIEEEIQPIIETPDNDFIADQLVVNFLADSWVRIKDANGVMLKKGLIKSGEILHLDGPLPYSVFLGDARKVTVKINGKIFKHLQYMNEQNVARFKVK